MKTILLPQNNEIETERGIVIVGANGSGKTRFGSWIDTESSQKNITHRVSAQKSLNIPENIRSMATDKSLAALLCGHENALPKEYDSHKKGHKWRNEPVTILIDDYEKLLVYLFSENNEISNKYLEDSKESSSRVEPPITKIATVKKIWEEIMPHRELIIGSGSIQACPKNKNKSTYNASKMSDGERVTFYLIGQCLSAQQNSILVIDEPELHLHKSIQYALWDRIENERNDCLFVYLTHDVEFAASRVGFKKIWLTDYDGTKWDWEELDDEMEIPEELLLEVYGSRKQVLLVEGDNSSYDVKLYKSIFKDFLVKPCGSCVNVITYTKSLRSNQRFHQLDVFGLIDKDRRTKEEIISLEESGIFTLNVAEVENLFATPEILQIVANHLELNFEEKLTAAKQFVINALKTEVEIQTVEKTIQELNQILSKSDLSSKTREDLKNKYTLLINSINFDKIYDKIKTTFDTMITNNDYEMLLSFYNRKSIASRIGSIFGLNDKELPALITRLSQNEKYTDEFKIAINKFLPLELVALINKKDVKEGKPVNIVRD